jgi:hypothetical protein
MRLGCTRALDNLICMWKHLVGLIVLMILSVVLAAAEPALVAGFRASAWMSEQVNDEWHDGGVRLRVLLPADFDAAKPTRLILYATPNGNTLEQTLGCKAVDGLDWHFGIQHTAAQVRHLATFTQARENTALAVVEAGGLSWPSYRAKFKDNPARIRGLVDRITKLIPGSVHVTLTGHSGGGSFTSGFLNGGDAIPDIVDRIAYLDSNYSYNDDEHHGDKLLAWLRGDAKRKLVVIAYDDREITLNGKKVVSATGGTWRSTERMMTRFKKVLEFKDTSKGDLDMHTAMSGQILIRRHRNPQNKILHTALVGDMNGLLEALAFDEDFKWGTFAGGVAYADKMQPAPGWPPRAKDAMPASKMVEAWNKLSKVERETAIASEMMAGNVPGFLRKFVEVKYEATDAAGKSHTVRLEVLPDFLSVGTDTDWMRMPMTPQTATRIAEMAGAMLPTPAMVDRIHAAAAVKLVPVPLGEPRETLEQFANHHHKIEAQREGEAREIGKLVSGVKKDIVLSNRIWEKPRRLALYGWHQDDGKPIQPLTIVHHDGYVDYSHGARLVKRMMLIDDKPRDLIDVLRDVNLATLVSNEDVLMRPGY